MTSYTRYIEYIVLYCAGTAHVFLLSIMRCSVSEVHIQADKIILHSLTLTLSFYYFLEKMGFCIKTAQCTYIG